MRTIVLLATGIWIGREIFQQRAQEKISQREKLLRKRLQHFLTAAHPGSSDNISQQINELLR